MKTAKSVRLIVRSLALVAVLAAAAAFRGVVHVPVGHFAASGNRILTPGWHLVSPLRSALIVEVEAEGALPPLAAANREGTRAEASIAFHYRADLRKLADAAAARKQSFHDLMESSAAAALVEVGGQRSVAQWLDRAGVDPLLQGSLARHFSEIGLDISSVRWEVRLPSELQGSLLQEKLRTLERQTGVRILLVGLDAADWESIDPLLAQGRLPAFRALLDNGVRGPLRSYNPMVSPLLWTTIATGKGPDVHGVADFSAVDEKSGTKVPISSRFRKVEALWNILSDLDRKTAVVGWWASYPADRIRGVMVTDRVAALSMLANRETLARNPGYTYPGDLLPALLPDFSRPDTISLEEVRAFADVTAEEYRRGLDWIAHPPPVPAEGKGKAPVQDPVGLLLKILTAAKNYQAATLDVLKQGPFDLAAVYFEGIDLVGHRFQHYRPPKMAMVKAADYAKFHDVVTAYYLYQDSLLGELMRRAGPETTIMVISDHGFKTGSRRPEGILPYTVDQPVEWHREDGIFLLSGPAAGRGALAQKADLFDIAPTLLALLGAPVPSDMPGKVLTSAIEPRLLQKFPPAAIASYEGVGGGRQMEEESASQEVSSEMMAQLRALGYVGADAPPTGKQAAPSTEAARAATVEGQGTTVSYHRNLATYYLSRGDPEKAVAELQQANRREKLPKSYDMLAEAYDALGRKNEALAALEEGWKELPEAMAADSVLWFVQLSIDVGDAARGRAFLEEHQSRLSAAPAVRQASEGLLAQAAGNLAQAVSRYRSALAADPTLVGAARPLAALYSREGKLEALRPILEAGLRKSERIDEYHNLLGALDSQRGDKESGLAHFRRAVELSPQDPRFTLNLALTLMDVQRWEEAASILEKAAATPKDPSLMLALGNARLRQGRAEDALAAFQSAARLGADPTRSDMGTALSYLAMKRRTEALSFLQQRIAMRPGDSSIQRLYQDIQSHP